MTENPTQFTEARIQAFQTNMAPKMRWSVNDTAKSKAWAAAEAKKKAAEEEKKLSALQQHLSKIKKATLDEYNWPKYWAEIRD